jgi:predicted  nucleic acid-binding Zn-ribbon protein
MKRGYAIAEVIGAFLIVGTLVFAFIYVVSSFVAMVSGPKADPRDKSIKELREQLADANKRLKAEATPQVEMLDRVNSQKAHHDREVAELQQRIVGQAKLLEDLRVDPALAGLQSRLKEEALRSQKIEQHFRELEGRLREMQTDIEGKANRGHSHL